MDVEEPAEGIFPRPFPQVAERDIGRQGRRADPRRDDEMLLRKDIATVRLEFVRL